MSFLEMDEAAERMEASMRPGQAAPDELGLHAGVLLLLLLASMRPGQAAPDEDPRPRAPKRRDYASMRPGQAAPDEYDQQSTSLSGYVLLQ